MIETSRVIIVEDNPLEAKHMQRLIEDAGCAVDIAENGRAGLEQVRQNPPAVVVTDLQMPIMNGLELTQRLQKEFPRLPVIVATGVGNEEIASQALHLGAASYVPKTRLATLFVPTVRRMIRRVYASRVSRQVEPFVRRSELHLEVGNDDTLVPQLVASLLEYVRAYGFCGESDLMRIGTALEESLLNAILHGNLEIDSGYRESDAAGVYREQVRSRRQLRPYCERKVNIALRIIPDEIRFVISDEGPGFDPTAIPDPTRPGNMERASGRGMLLIKTFMNEVFHNRQGNQITMVKLRSQLPSVGS